MIPGSRTALSSLLLVGLAACSSSAADDPPAKEATNEVAAPVPSEPGLSADELKAVLDGAKVDVRRTCSPLARLRERVDIDLTIAGSSGSVVNTNISVNGGNPELASCVASELARSSFPKAPRVTRTTVSITF